MKHTIDPSEITPEELYVSRRRFIKNALTVSAAAFLAGRSGKSAASAHVDTGFETTNSQLSSRRHG
jgi:hypothetical protein